MFKYTYKYILKGAIREATLCTVYFILFSLKTKYLPRNLLCSPRLSIMCFVLYFRDQVSHPYTTTNKVALLFLIRILLERGWGGRFWQNSDLENLITAFVLGLGLFSTRQMLEFATEAATNRYHVSAAVLLRSGKCFQERYSLTER